MLWISLGEYITKLSGRQPLQGFFTVFRGAYHNDLHTCSGVYGGDAHDLSHLMEFKQDFAQGYIFRFHGPDSVLHIPAVLPTRIKQGIRDLAQRTDLDRLHQHGKHVVAFCRGLFQLL